MSVTVNYITPEEIIAANRRFDRAHPGFVGEPGHIRASWNESRLVMRKALTDKAIAKYSQQGLYSQEVKDYRRALAAKRKSLREGNFLRREDGSLVYAI